MLTVTLVGVMLAGLFGSWSDQLERELAPKPIPLSDFHTPEQLADQLSRSAGTRIATGPGWWSVEITQPVMGPFGEAVSCRRYVRTVADGRTETITGDWRYTADGVRTCRYPAAAGAPS